MRVLGPVTGISGFRAPSEEMGSPNGAPVQDVITFIASIFEFAISPSLPQAQLNVPFTFQHGKITLGKERVAINSLLSTPDGIVVACRRTEIADMVLDRFSEAMDGTFFSRYQQVQRPRLRSSTMVVQFNRGFSENIQSLTGIEKIITDAVDLRSRDSRMGVGPFRMKRILFGQEPGDIQPSNPFEALERQDFVIESRVQHDLSENVFFCSAPLTTERHIEALEQIDAASR